MCEVSAPRYFDYSAFFHYRHDYNVEVFVKWVRENSLEAVMSVEKEDAVNLTDRHLQVWMRRDSEWDVSMTNVFGAKGRMGKYLVKAKTPNEGQKSGKRWSKVLSTISKLHGIQYVLKDGGRRWLHNVELTPAMTQPPDAVYALRDLRRKKQAKLESGKAFFQKLMDLWESSGRPRDHRDIYAMIVDHCVLNKWNYCDARSIYRMATYVSLRTNPAPTRDRLLRDYDDI